MIETNEEKEDNNESFNDRNSNSEEYNNRQEKKRQIEMSSKELQFKSDKPIFLFKVRKLGVKGFTHKTRLLYITPEQICYYKMIEKNEKTLKFLDLLNSLYRVIKNNEYDQIIYKNMIEAFKILPNEEKVLKHSFTKYDIVIIKNNSSFKKAPIKVINLDVKNDQEKSQPENYWIMETGYECFRKTVIDSKKAILNYKHNSSNKLNENEK